MSNNVQTIHESKGTLLTRRQFLEVTGAVATVAGLTAMAVKSPFQVATVKAQTAPVVAANEQIIPSSCRMCNSLDGILVHVVNGQPTFIEGDPKDPKSFGRVCGKGNAAIYYHYDPYRVKVPLKRTNPNKGITEVGNWVEISWEEAYSTIANKIAAVRAKGANGYVRYSAYSALSYSQTWGSFRSAAEGQNYDLELEMNWCGHTAHYLSRQAHGAFTSAADYQRCKYLIQPGRTHGQQGGGSLMPYGVLLADGRANGMKIVNFSPFMSTAPGIADEWVPIAPDTEGAVASALLEVLLVELKQYDVPFLKASSNAPYLIGPNGMYVRDTATKKPLIWDSVDNKAKTYDDTTIKDYAILGSFTVSGIYQNIYNNDTSTLTNVTAKPAFQLLVDAVTPMTPEWAANISGAPAATIRRVANEYITASQIGSTITIGTRTLPFRPAATEYYGGGASNKAHGMANGMGWELLTTVTGAQDVPGGKTNSTAPGLVAGPDGLILPAAGPYTYGAPMTAKGYQWQFPPKTPELQEFFPVADHPPMPYLTMTDTSNPAYYGVGNIKLDVIFYHAWNPMFTMYDAKKMETIWKNAAFVAASCVWIEETAEGYADIVIPDRMYLEEYQMNSGVIMQPTCDPPSSIPYLHDVLSEISSRAGFLKDYNTNISSSLKDPYKFDVTQKISTPNYFDALLKSTYGAQYGLDWFKANGQGSFSKGPQTFQWQPWKNFTPARRLPVYFENQVELMTMLKKNMDANGVKWNFGDYSPVPTWIPPLSTQSTPPYDLRAIAWLHANGSYDWSNVNPLTTQINLEEPYMPYVAMHNKDAASRGIKEGDHVWVETEIDRQEGVVHLTEVIYPGTIAINRSMAGWARNSVVKDLYKSIPNVAFMVIRPVRPDNFDTLNGALDNTLRVRVYKV